jgi:hypothetical protein
MPDTVDNQQVWATTALEELRSNLEYARDLVRGGQFLESLQVGAFDVADLYRAAWVQAVSALDHWVHRELYERALAFALNIEEPRPARFLKLEVPLQLFEDVHHHAGDFRGAFEDYLRTKFGYQSFQAPEKIKQALSHVSEEPLWPGVAQRLAAAGHTDMATRDAVVACLGDIVERRNKIAHEADREPEDGTARRAISHHDATRTIDRIDRLASAIAAVLGAPPAPVHRPPAVVPTASPKQELYLRFWSQFKEVVERRGWTKAQPQAQNWWNMPGGVTGTTWALSFSRFGCRSELYFEHPDPATNLRRWHLLADRRAEIEARFGDGLIFDDLPQNKGCRIETRLHDVTIEDLDRWPGIQHWMEDTQIRLRGAVAAVGGVPG